MKQKKISTRFISKYSQTNVIATCFKEAEKLRVILEGLDLISWSIFSNAIMWPKKAFSWAWGKKSIEDQPKNLFHGISP